jgi:hypothetical protein
MRRGKAAVVLLYLAVGLAPVAGCGSHHESRDGSVGAPGPEDDTGRVGFQYSLPGGEHISLLTYSLTDGAHTYSGNVNTAGASSLSFVVGGVAAAGGYTVALSAQSDDGLVSCTGSYGTGISDAGQNNGDPFAVLPRQTTVVNVQMICEDVPNQSQGAVIVNGIASCCATWDTIEPVPSALSTQPPNNVSQLTGHASGACSGLACLWSIVSGTGTLTQSPTDVNGYTYGTFTCPATTTETDTLQFLCTDGPLPDGGFCPAWLTTGTTTITCTSPIVNYSVVRHGAIGAMQLTDGNATPAFVENHSLNLSTNADTLLSTIAMPTAASGAQQPLMLLGISSAAGGNDGALSRSVDGHYLTLVGYGATPGMSSIVAMPVPRVVARIDAMGNVDTSTYLRLPPADGGTGGAYQNAFIRSSASIDGTAFWTGGGDSTAAGAWYIPFGAAGDGTQLNTSLTRIVNIVGGQLYGDSFPMGTQPELFAVGSGAPFVPPAAITGVPGFPMTQMGSTVVSAWAFAFAGTDTIYVATDQDNLGGNPVPGIQKWTLSGGMWSLQTTFNLATGQSVAPPVGFRGLAVVGTVGPSTTFVASTVEAGSSPVPANHLAVFVDNGGPYSGGPTGLTEVGVLFAQAPSQTVYRGVALSPQ